MKILITNDDGVTAVGLHVLATVLGSSHDVYIVAPDQERSGVSHAFTLHHPLRCDATADVLPEGLVRGIYKCSGTPADCVKLALLSAFVDMTFDLVVSGINRGANLAVDTLYSGTVAGAMEALIMGVPAMAVSLVSRGRETSTRQHFETAAECCLEFLKKYHEKVVGNREFMLNMNVPGIPREEVKGFRFTRVGRSRYSDRYHMHRDPHGRPYYWLDGDIATDEDSPEADIVAVRESYVSVTPLRPDLTHPEGLSILGRWG